MKSLNIENKGLAVVHEKQSVARKRGYSVAADFHRPRSASMESIYTVESDYEVDADILANVRPESPSLPLQKVL